MTVLHSGSTKAFEEGWSRIFGNPKTKKKAKKNTAKNKRKGKKTKN